MFISIPDNIGLSETANLPSKLKLFVGARVVLTDNICVSDILINSSLVPLRSTRNAEFDDAKSTNSLRDSRLRGELKECVLITARRNRFSL